MLQPLFQIEKIGKIGVFLGGTSHERSISIKSGEAVCKALEAAGFNITRVDTANGFRSKLSNGSIDVAFLALHGIGGEDGKIQRILERYKIPYTGSGPKASGRAFNKAEAKQTFVKNSIPTPRYDILTKSNWKKKISKWKAPYVSKPLDEGSSIGVEFFERNNEPKLRKNVNKYGKLLIEEKINGREFTVGILGSKALPVIELKPKRKFYDFKAKYTKGLTKYLVPAPISDKLSKNMQRIALKVHHTLGLTDFSRIDFMYDQAENIYVLEANSIPGFTETSLVPKAAKEIGINFTNLCLFLLRKARVGKE